MASTFTEETCCPNDHRLPIPIYYVNKADTVWGGCWITDQHIVGNLMKKLEGLLKLKLAHLFELNVKDGVTVGCIYGTRRGWSLHVISSLDSKVNLRRKYLTVHSWGGYWVQKQGKPVNTVNYSPVCSKHFCLFLQSIQSYTVSWAGHLLINKATLSYKELKVLYGSNRHERFSLGITVRCLQCPNSSPKNGSWYK